MRASAELYDLRHLQISTIPYLWFTVGTGQLRVGTREIQ